jgi:hypothetical protein
VKGILRAALVGLVATGLLLDPSAAGAHHSFAAEYDAARPITLKGEVLRVDFVNPHGWLYVAVKDAKGRRETWNVEMGSPNSLIRRGFTKNSVPVGTEVIINGYRAKDGSRTVNGTNVTLADGRKLFTGSPGTGAPDEKK